MRCVSCGIDVPPQFLKAIESNCCPSCGLEIMTTESKSLLTELADAISKMPNDPQGLAGWIMTNYRIKKIGEAEPTEKFYRPGQSGKKSGNKNQEESTQGSKDYNGFLERTGMASKVRETMSRKDQLAKMASSILDEDDAYGNFGQNIEQDDEPNEEDLAALREFQAAGLNPFGKSKSSKTGGLSPEQIIAMQSREYIAASQDDDDPEALIPEEVALINAGPAGHRLVNETRMKRIKAQDALRSGTGLFKRS